ECDPRNRELAGIAHPRSLPQADFQDRKGAAQDRGRPLRLLRGNRRGNRPRAPRSTPDRDPLPRRAGTPRTSAEADGRLTREFLPPLRGKVPKADGGSARAASASLYSTSLSFSARLTRAIHGAFRAACGVQIGNPADLVR